MNKIFSVLGLFALTGVLVGCQAVGDSEVNDVKEKEEVEASINQDHPHSENTENLPEEVEIKGVAGHYHTGNIIKLTAVLKEESSEGHWHWYSKKKDSSEWNLISGEESAVFKGKATSDVTIFKSVWYGEDGKPKVQSAPVEIKIDDHHDDSENTTQIYNGYFEDDQVKERELSDWEGDWQSVYPYLISGELDEVFAHKAEKGDMSAEEYKEYYTTGYVTDVNRILIDKGKVTFYEGDDEYSGEYASAGYEILTYEKGNRGVRFIFELKEGSEKAPQYIQFSDHNIFPIDSHHFHLYWGNDSEQLLKEMTHWPTYYPASLDGYGLVQDMLAH